MQERERDAIRTARRSGRRAAVVLRAALLFAFLAAGMARSVYLGGGRGSGAAGLAVPGGRALADTYDKECLPSELPPGLDKCGYVRGPVCAAEMGDDGYIPYLEVLYCSPFGPSAFVVGALLLVR